MQWKSFFWCVYFPWSFICKYFEAFDQISKLFRQWNKPLIGLIHHIHEQKAQSNCMELPSIPNGLIHFTLIKRSHGEYFRISGHSFVFLHAKMYFLLLFQNVWIMFATLMIKTMEDVCKALKHGFNYKLDQTVEL